MPASSFADYCCKGGVDLTDKLSPAQIRTLLAANVDAIEAARSAATQKLPPGKRLALPGLALLHAYEATHGKGCALSDLRPGPLPNEERDDCMLQLYRKLAGDSALDDRRLIDTSRKLHQRRFTGGARPSPAMRRTFGNLSLRPRESLGIVGGAEKLGMDVNENLAVLKKCPEMDVSHVHVGDYLLVQGLSPDGSSTRWYRGRVLGFSFRCLFPPIHIRYVATEDGRTDAALLPAALEIYCRKRQTKAMVSV